MLGPPWQGSRGAWFYPREQPNFRATGYATVAAPMADASASYADGARADTRAMTASMQTLPLPAVVSVRNLDDGRTVLVRVDGRGPPDPGRLIALGPAAAALLGVAAGRPVPVEVIVDEARTRAALDCAAGRPELALQAAPVQAVSEQTLPPPGQGGAGGAVENGGAGGGAGGAARACGHALPDTVSAGYATPGRPFIDAGSFSAPGPAATVAARVGGTVQRTGSGRSAGYAVRVGPFADAADADAALDRLASAGVTGARITIE